ncbi:prephenate dehydrogenase [Variovorax ginsengisoli]|uniref:Prephenate dehydrogenase n=1 Tax=Variovorax ginsengisoli TaxID=363844 RepID=A0ABT9SHN6_9BURK|nr:prephenate dehydrogenase [Variovorax ginsengisoli]MDP9902902.1 prephenate dehydrogenase [Variovorax ginsengisoli]
MASPSLFPLPGIDRIAVCGVGLIGGSIVRALRAMGRPVHITGFDTDAALLERLRAEGWIDEIAQEGGALFDSHDLVVLCQPVGCLVEFIEEHGARIGTGRAVCLDVASVKAPVAAALAHGGPAAVARFVPSHPIAGKALHGWAASEAGLFEGKRCVLTPDAGTDRTALDTAQAFWSLLGAQVATMPASAHDAVYAAISHLPQVLTYAYLHSLAARPDAREWPAYQGSGFVGFTRLGSSDAALWADIAVHNRRPLIHEIDCLSDALALMRHQLALGDAGALAESFEAARHFHAESSRPAAGSAD